jgi:hypothetical protein
VRAHFTILVNLDTVNERGLEREDSLDTDTAGNLANGKGLGERIRTLHLDDDTAELLVALLVSFFDPVGHGDRVTSLELREFSGLATGKSLLCYLIKSIISILLARNVAVQLLAEVALVWTANV